jgi:uncharacterized membrane protein YidH (DUF202 family)
MTTVDSQAQTQTQQQRVEQFKQEIADMRLRDPSTARDRLLLRTGIALMAIGVGFTVVGYFLSHTTKDVLQQNDAQVSAMIGIAITIVGAALFLRYSIAQFMRFWLARLTYEQSHQTDRIVEAINET